MAEKSVTGMSQDDYFQSTVTGSVDKAIGNNLYGINMLQAPGMVPTEKEGPGFVFFTRPQLNLQINNLRNYRKLYPLLSQNMRSIQAFTKCTLDPRLIYGYETKNFSLPPIACPIVDNENAFIPVLTNDCTALSGFPDTVVPTFTSKPGLYNQVYRQVDGTIKNFTDFDITATFRNTQGSPILFLMYVWELYMSLVFEGVVVPYPDFISHNRIDYNTRIYRLRTTIDRKYVTGISATGAAFPSSNSTGSLFDFSLEKPIMETSRDITIQFAATGAIIYDDILIKNFNTVVEIFNPAMRDNKRASSMVKVPLSLTPIFNNRAYPRINYKTYELEWYVSRDMYAKRAKGFLQANVSASDDSDQTGD